MRYWIGVCLLVIGLAGCANSEGVEAMSSNESMKKVVEELKQSALVEGGRLAVILSATPKYQPDRGQQLFIIDKKEIAQLILPRLDGVQWINLDRLVASYAPNGHDTLIGIVASEGKLVSAIPETKQFGFVTPSLHDHYLATYKIDKKTGVKVLEILDVSEQFKLVSSFPKPDVREVMIGGNIVWSPDGRLIATYAGVPEEKGYVSRIGLLSVQEPLKKIEILYNNKEPIVRASPLFWLEDGIYVVGQIKESSGLYRCDPYGNGCQHVYSPEEGKRIFSGAAVGKKHALLLVQDLKTDPFEIRGKEIHLVNLASGKGEKNIILPNQIFVDGIAWINN